MSLSLAIAINVLLDVVLLAGLAYVMSRTTRLQRHVSGRQLEASGLMQPSAADERYQIAA
jgi:hypothetical protein